MGTESGIKDLLSPFLFLTGSCVPALTMHTVQRVPNE